MHLYFRTGFLYFLKRFRVNDNYSNNFLDTILTIDIREWEDTKWEYDWGKAYTTLAKTP